MHHIIKIIRKLIFSVIFLYTFNLMSQSLNIMIPINVITISYITLFGPVALVSLILIYLLSF